MKKIAIAVIILSILFAFNVFTVSAEQEENNNKEEIKIESGFCPVTKIKGKINDCLMCHAEKTFKIKPVQLFEDWDLPNIYSSMIMEDNKPVATYKVHGSIYSNSIGFNELLIYLENNHKEVEKVIINMHSPGGSLFEGYKFVGIIKHWQSKGWIIETRVHGFAASAGFLIFCAGNPRAVSPQAELMWHELITFRMFEVSGPADKEDQAAVLRHLQDTANSMIADISNLTKDELDQKIRKKEYWVNGKEAFEFGFATRLME